MPGLQSASVSQIHTCSSHAKNKNKLVCNFASCWFCSLKIYSSNYLLCQCQENCNSITKTTVQCNNNSPAVPLCRTYKPLAATTAWNNCSLKFCGRSFHQDGDPRHCSCALSTWTPRGEKRGLASQCFPLPVLRPQLQKLGKGKVSCQIRRSSRGCYYFCWRVLFFHSDSIKMFL